MIRASQAVGQEDADDRGTGPVHSSKILPQSHDVGGVVDSVYFLAAQKRILLERQSGTCFLCERSSPP